jgi:uncharacterized protein (TIGR03067 family)
MSVQNPSPGPSPERGGEEEVGWTFSPPSLLGKRVGGLGSEGKRRGGLGLRRFLLPILVLAAAAAGLWFAFSGNREPGNDLARLQGVWKVSAYGRDTQATIRVEGDRWTYSAGGMKGHSYRLTLRPDASPKQIDLVLLDDAGQPVEFTHGAKKGSPVSLHGVYSIEDETLGVALAPGMEPRPTAMDGDGSMTLTRTAK